MTQLTDAKMKYDRIPIPEELSDVVQTAVNYSEERRRKLKYRKRIRRAKKFLAAAAVMVIVFTVGLNNSTAFAESMGSIPVIGTIANVLTFRSYETTTEDMSVSVEIPSVELIGKESGLTDALNEEIHNRCEEYAQEAVKRAEEYKEAFMATGGTEEEWKAHNIEIKVWYEIKAQTEHYLSFAVMGAENWVSAYNETRYYNLDLSSGKTVTLEDLLGSDYIRIVNESVEKQIQQRSESGEGIFFAAGEGGFAGISQDVKFYINESENPVVVFEQYEIAPGSEGMPEFEIQMEQKEGTVPEKGDSEEVTGEVPAEEGMSRSLDNFDMDPEEVTAFAEEIKAAVLAGDLEALADLTAFPVYVGIREDGVVQTREDFLELDAAAVITPELMESVEGADTAGLSASMAGFTLMTDGLKGSITFGVTKDGLAVTGINYGF